MREAWRGLPANQPILQILLFVLHCLPCRRHWTMEEQKNGSGDANPNHLFRLAGSVLADLDDATGRVVPLSEALSLARDGPAERHSEDESGSSGADTSSDGELERKAHGLDDVDESDSDSDAEGVAESRRRWNVKHRVAIALVGEFLSLKELGKVGTVSVAWNKAVSTGRIWRKVFRRRIGAPTSRRLQAEDLRRDAHINWKWEVTKQVRARREMGNLPFYMALGAHEDEIARNIYWELKRRSALTHHAEHRVNNLEYRAKRLKRLWTNAETLLSRCEDIMEIQERLDVRFAANLAFGLSPHKWLCAHQSVSHTSVRGQGLIRQLHRRVARVQTNCTELGLLDGSGQWSLERVLEHRNRCAAACVSRTVPAAACLPAESGEHRMSTVAQVLQQEIKDKMKSAKLAVQLEAAVDKRFKSRLRRLYGRRALRAHPDRVGDNPENRRRFQELSAAAELLLDDSLRKLYNKVRGTRGGSRCARLTMPMCGGLPAPKP